MFSLYMNFMLSEYIKNEYFLNIYIILNSWIELIQTRDK